MLEKVIRLYYAYMATDVRSPIPHLAGPPGTNKSGVVQQLADLLGVTMHTFNVARISPLELEGVQMPTTSTNGVEHDMVLKLLHAPMWTQLKEGDIVFLDEFMRGFPEVYNGMLDIMTSREVAGYQLPKVFFIGASNSVAAYDPALEDRLLHVFVPDLRKQAGEREHVKQLFIDELGLDPRVAKFTEFDDMLREEVYPMFTVLDQFKHNKPGQGAVALRGHSVRNLIGQVKLREVQSATLKDLIEMNNTVAMQQDKAQFVILLSGKNPNPNYVRLANKLRGNPKLTPIQAQNLELNLQLIEMEAASRENYTEGDIEDDPDLF